MREKNHKNEFTTKNINFIFLMIFYIISVPLFIFILTTIYDKLVLAKVGKRSPTICTNSNAIIFRSSSISLSF
mgnify:FL=1